MNKTFKLYGIIFLVVLGILALLEFSKNEVLDWRKNFDTNKKTPFGLFVFQQEAQKLLNNQLKTSAISPYDYYTENKNEKPHNILIIENELDQESWKKILKEVSKGSTLLLISDFEITTISDTLEVYPENINFEDINTLKLTDTKFQKDSLYLDKLPERYGFSYLPKEIEILGSTASSSTNINASFIKSKFGKGMIYYHTEPLFLTNYYLLNPKNTPYFEDVFSYLPNQPTLWFKEKSNTDLQTELSVILQYPALRYAWQLLLVGLLLFIIFNAKRKQRIVPIIEPKKNKSVEFVKSIGNLYLQEGDFHDMMSKKAQYFLSKVRMDLLIDTKNLDEEFAKKLQLKTGKNIDTINKAITLIKKAQDPYSGVIKEDLLEMNTLLDEILK